MDIDYKQEEEIDTEHMKKFNYDLFYALRSGRIPVFCGFEENLGLQYQQPYQRTKKRGRVFDNNFC